MDQMLVFGIFFCCVQKKNVLLERLRNEWGIARSLIAFLWFFRKEVGFRTAPYSLGLYCLNTQNTLFNSLIHWRCVFLNIFFEKRNVYFSSLLAECITWRFWPTENCVFLFLVNKCNSWRIENCLIHYLAHKCNAQGVKKCSFWTEKVVILYLCCDR